MWDGPIVIFAKASPYNFDPSTYDARHAKMGRERFGQYIAEHVRFLQSNEEYFQHSLFGFPPVCPQP